MIRRLALLFVVAVIGAVVVAPAQAADAAVSGPGSVEVGSAIHLSGTGWKLTDGSAGSVVAFKLDEGAITTKVDVSDPVKGTVFTNKTIWAAVKADEDGKWSVDLPYPTTANASATWAAGSTHTVRVLSGSLSTGDVSRTQDVTVRVVAAGGAEPTPTPTPTTSVPTTSAPTTPAPSTGSGTTCSTDVAVATAKATVTKAGFGGVVHLTGAGWCHPGAGEGGSTIGVKIDDGVYSRLDSSVHINRTVWAIVRADAATGVIDADIAIPTGRSTGTDGSTPALTEGSHTLRLLSGSLSDGDTIRTVQTNAFTVGAYRPTSEPDPLDYAADLTTLTRAATTVRQSSSKLQVTVPNAAKGDWVYLSTYYRDGSPSFPFGQTWFRAGDGGVVTASLTGVTLDAGRLKLVAQSGNDGQVGTLLGWVWIGSDDSSSNSGSDSSGGSTDDSTDDSTDTDADTGTDSSTGTAASDSTVVTASSVSSIGDLAKSLATSAKPTSTPKAPVGEASDLTGKNAGNVKAATAAGIVTVTAAALDPGAWAYVHVYPDEIGAKPIAVGWIQLDAGRRLKLDLTKLPTGGYKIALQDHTGSLVGWAPTELTGTGAATGASSDTVVPQNASATVGRTGWQIPVTPLDLWLLGAGVAVLVGSAGGVLTSTRRSPKGAH